MSGSRKAPRAKDVISIPNAEAAARKAKQDLLNQIKEHQSELRAAIEAAFAELFQGIEGTSRRKRTGGTINVYAQSEVDQKLAEIENHFKNQIAQANESKSPNPDDQPSRPRTSSFALNLSRSPSPEATQAEERSPTPQPVATQPNSDALDTAAVLAHYDAMQNALNRFIDEQNGLTEAQKAFFKKAVNDWRIEDAHSRIDQNSNSLSATRSELIGAWGILTTAIATQMQQLQELTDRNQLAAQLKGLKVPTTIPRSAATTETPEQKEESLEEKIQKIAQAHRRLEGQKEQARAEQLKRLAEQQARTAAAKATQTKPTAQKAPPAAPPRAPAKPSQPAAATTKPEAPPKPTNEKASEKKAESKPAPKQPTPAAKTSPQKQHESKPAVPAKPTTPPPAAQTSKSSAAAKPVSQTPAKPATPPAQPPAQAKPTAPENLHPALAANEKDKKREEQTAKANQQLAALEAKATEPKRVRFLENPIEWGRQLFKGQTSTPANPPSSPASPSSSTASSRRGSESSVDSQAPLLRRNEQSSESTARKTQSPSNTIPLPSHPARHTVMPPLFGDQIYKSTTEEGAKQAAKQAFTTWQQQKSSSLTGWHAYASIQQQNTQPYTVQLACRDTHNITTLVNFERNGNVEIKVGEYANASSSANVDPALEAKANVLKMGIAANAASGNQYQITLTKAEHAKQIAEVLSQHPEFQGQNNPLRKSLMEALAPQAKKDVEAALSTRSAQPKRERDLDSSSPAP